MKRAKKIVRKFKKKFRLRPGQIRRLETPVWRRMISEHEELFTLEAAHERAIKKLSEIQHTDTVTSDII